MTLKTTSVAVVKSMQLPRKPEFDALRGLFLVWMTLTHLPTRLSDLVNQPFGFISSAEGFVFLSALLVGRVYMRQALENPGGLRSKLWKRALRVYAYHVTLLLLAFTFAAAFRRLPASRCAGASAGFLHCASGGRHHRLAAPHLLSAAPGYPAHLRHLPAGFAVRVFNCSKAKLAAGDCRQHDHLAAGPVPSAHLRP